MRKDAWQIMDADFELVHTDRTAKIRRKDGKPFNCAAVELQQYTERPQADYFDFSAVSDGGASVFTGYFLSQVRVEDNWYDTILKAKYIGSEGEKAITREPGRLVEQFDYYGTQDPLETDGIVAVVDSALPANITSNITETISAVNALLAETFDFYPKEPYLVLIAADFKAFEGYSV
ncbi:MAG: hypothetical protein R3281_00650 [Balneolaceae bacterium]|nr:hypothetical protein [Balneolaceae bacterium]